MKRKRIQRTYSMLAYALIGFILGAIGVLIATLVALFSESSQISAAEAIRVQLENPLLWMIDLLPFVSAFLLGFAGAREDQMAEIRYRNWRNSQLHSEDVKRLSAKAEDLEQKRLEARTQLEELATATQVQSEDLRRFQAEMAEADQKRAETGKIIGRAKREWESTFDSVRDGILLTDANETIIRCNHAVSEMFQLGYLDIIGKPVADFVRSENSLLGPSALAAQKSEIQIPALSGWYEVSQSKLEIDGAWAGSVYLLRDVTDRVQALQSLQLQKEYYESLVRSIPIAVVTLKMDLSVVECNPAFENLFGYTAQEALGKPLDELISLPDLTEESRRLSSAVRRGKLVHKITRRQHKDGHSLEVELFAIPVTINRKQIGIQVIYLEMRGSSGQGIPGEPEVSILKEAGDVEEWPETTTTKKAAILPWVPTIDGLPPEEQKKLAGIGILTDQDLLQYTTNRKDRARLSSQLGIPPELLQAWVNRSDLKRITGADTSVLSLLELAGVRSLADLRRRNPEKLYSSMVKAVGDQSSNHALPTLNDVTGWVDAARHES